MSTTPVTYETYDADAMAVDLLALRDTPEDRELLLHLNGVIDGFRLSRTLIDATAQAQ